MNRPGVSSLPSMANLVRPNLPEALGQAEVFLDFQERLSRVARVDRPVLLVGERGTGKELAAARLHHLSQRWQGPLVALNCAALSPSLLESELFGHEAGAFTGAGRRRVGRFEAANGGTLFLDEIGLIPMEVQEKILRVVEYGAFERVGSSEPVQVDARIIGATNANLAGLAASGKFKADLLDRLSFEVLFLPPLRLRGEDILILARHFAARMAMELGRPDSPEFADSAIQALESHPWPGNVRELKNAVERAVYQCEGAIIREINFDPFRSPFGTTGEAPPVGRSPVPTAEESPAVVSEVNPARPAAAGVRGEAGGLAGWLQDRPLEEAVREYEFTALRLALEEARWHQGEAAQRLGLSYHQFRGLYRKYQDRMKGLGGAQEPG